jgi:hypothetical protein
MQRLRLRRGDAYFVPHFGSTEGEHGLMGCNDSDAVVRLARANSYNVRSGIFVYTCRNCGEVVTLSENDLGS